MPTPLQRAYRFCLGDGSLTIAVFILIFFVFALYPMVEVGVIRRFWLDLAFAAFFALGAVFVFEPRPMVRLFIIFLVGTVVASLVEDFFERSWLFFLRSVLTMLASGVFGALLLTRVMRDGRINLNRIMGAIGSYLLIGIIFTQAYRLLADLIPGAFAIGGVPAAFGDISAKLPYYSFITLTSTGYGNKTRSGTVSFPRSAVCCIFWKAIGFFMTGLHGPSPHPMSTNHKRPVGLRASSPR